jgi:tellurite resistance protein TerC
MLANSLIFNPEIIFYLIFGFIIIGFLVIDLGVIHKSPKKVSTSDALQQSIFWVAVSVAFGLSILLFGGGINLSLEFFSAYLTEKALSIDNIFVILLILRYFKVEEKYYHKILFWGILGAIIFRAVFIFTGVYLINQFHGLLYVFGAFLFYSGFKLLFANEDGNFNPEDSPVIKFGRKYLKITKGNFNGKFILFHRQKLYFTPLFLVIILIEFTDLIFALDSIPAVFAISQNQFILYTSNIFAVMGLRAMFFLMAGVLDKFYLLQKGLSLILIFIGAKMLLELVNINIPVLASFSFIIGSISLSILFSLMKPKAQLNL